MKHVLALAGVTCVAFVLFYLSRYWFLQLWDRPGAFGWDQLPPQGGLLGRWLRGTDAAPFELLIWGVGAFLVLSLIEWVAGRLKGGEE